MVEPAPLTALQTLDARLALASYVMMLGRASGVQECRETCLAEDRFPVLGSVLTIIHADQPLMRTERGV